MNHDPINAEQSGAHNSSCEPTALHARDRQDQSTASRSMEMPIETYIPLLNDIVAEPSIYRPTLACTGHNESSADDQLARTNKYKTLSERDLERAEAANDTPEVEPPTTDDTVSMLMLDECLIDDDLEIDFDEDTGFENSLRKLERELDSEDAKKLQYQTILPDLDKLNNELGVDPLPFESSTTAAAPIAATMSLHSPVTPQSTPDLSAGGAAANKPGTGEVTPEPPRESSAIGEQTFSLQVSGIALSGSTIFSALPNPLSLASTSDTNLPPCLSDAELEIAVDEALAQALPALKRAVLQKLAPLLCKDSATKPV